jgi:hypothetical protein
MGLLYLDVLEPGSGERLLELSAVQPPASVPTFILAQLVGTAGAILTLRVLYPDVTADEAANVVLPHNGQPAGAVSGAARG